MTIKQDMKTLGELTTLQGLSRVPAGGKVIVIAAWLAFFGPFIAAALWFARG